VAVTDVTDSRIHVAATRERDSRNHAVGTARTDRHLLTVKNDQNGENLKFHLKKLDQLPGMVKVHRQHHSVGQRTFVPTIEAQGRTSPGHGRREHLVRIRIVKIDGRVRVRKVKTVEIGGQENQNSTDLIHRNGQKVLLSAMTNSLL